MGNNLFLYLCTHLNLFRYTATKCGHRTKQNGSVSAFGRTITTEMPKNENGSVDYCLDCIGKMAIRCAWCGEPIFIGDPVTLYSPPMKEFQIPQYAVIYSEVPLRFIGCLGWDCADTGADRSGFWLPDENGKGFVYRVPTIYEKIFETKGPSVMIIDDLGDRRETMSFRSVRRPEMK